MQIQLTITTQMTRTEEIEGNLDGWERITNSPSANNNNYGQGWTEEQLHRDRVNPLRTLRVDETCPLHEDINSDFNRGGDCSSFTTCDRASSPFKNSFGQIATQEEILEILHYAINDGRFGVALGISDDDVNGEEVENLGLPKSVAKNTSRKVWTGEGDRFDVDMDAYLDESNYSILNSVEVAYKVNGSTGERNETGEKRVRRVLTALGSN